jgi:hypothetical protein
MGNAPPPPPRYLSPIPSGPTPIHEPAPAWTRSASGGAGSPPAGWTGSRTCPGPGGRGGSARWSGQRWSRWLGQLPAATGVPLTCWSGPELAAEITKAGLARQISPSSVLRILAEHLIKPWQYQSWVCPRDPDFAAKPLSSSTFTRAITGASGYDRVTRSSPWTPSRPFRPAADAAQPAGHSPPERHHDPHAGPRVLTEPDRAAAPTSSSPGPGPCSSSPSKSSGAPMTCTPSRSWPAAGWRSAHWRGSPGTGGPSGTTNGKSGCHVEDYMRLRGRSPRGRCARPSPAAIAERGRPSGGRHKCGRASSRCVDAPAHRPNPPNPTPIAERGRIFGSRRAQRRQSDRLGGRQP